MSANPNKPGHPPQLCAEQAEYRDTSAGRIPIDWDVKQISDAADPASPHSFTDGDWIESPHIRERGIRLIQTGNIGVGEFLDKADDRKFISEESFQSLRCKPLQPEDILICRLAEPVGRACLLPRFVGNAITSVDVTIFRPDSNVLDRHFAVSLLNTHAALKRCEMFAGGTTRKRISRLNLGRLPIGLPKVDEQSRIAAMLDTVDEAIAKTEAVIAKLRQVRAGLLHDLLTRGLNQNGQLRDPIAHPEQFQDSSLGQIPKEWVYESLGARLQRIGGTIQTGPFGSQLHAHEYTTQGDPVIMPQDVLEASVSLAQIARIPVARAEELKRHRVKLGDLVFARRGDLSRCAVITAREVGWLCGTGCLLMRFGESTLSPHWLSLAYRHDIGQRQIAARAVGTTMVNLNTKLLAHLTFGFPPKEEQQDVVQRVAEADATIVRECENLSKLGHVKSGLMTDLLTGRVRVPVTLGRTP